MYGSDCGGIAVKWGRHQIPARTLLLHWYSDFGAEGGRR